MIRLNNLITNGFYFYVRYISKLCFLCYVCYKYLKFDDFNNISHRMIIILYVSFFKELVNQQTSIKSLVKQ